MTANDYIEIFHVLRVNITIHGKSFPLINTVGLEKPEGTLNFKEMIQSQVELLDEHLARNRVPMSHRAFQAATIIVDHCVADMKGDTKDNYLEKTWFSDFYNVTDDWYRERYGTSYEESYGEKIKGVVDIYNTPFQISIPTSINKGKGEESGTFWFCLPKDVLSNEEPIEWIENLPKLKEDIKQTVSVRASEIASKLRGIRVNLMVQFPNSQSEILAAQIIPHFEKCATDLVRNKPHEASLAMWDLFMAVEKSFKAFLGQKNISFPTTHKLDKLNALSGNIVGSTILEEFISSEDAINYRYGELPVPIIDEAMSHYIQALDITTLLTSSLKRDIVFDNARFLLKCPPWVQKKA